MAPEIFFFTTPRAQVPQLIQRETELILLDRFPSQWLTIRTRIMETHVEMFRSFYAVCAGSTNTVLNTLDY